MGEPAGAVAVAYSGGRDSTALLHATLSAAAPLGLDVVALHVHHGLQPRADAWALHCEATCRAWTRAGARLAFVATRLEGEPPRGASLEAWARRERYRALRAMALESGARVVLLAHHRRDQAETFLLQALRGAGPAGLAAMPREADRAGLVWARPWLDRPREAIEAYVEQHGLGFVEDPSNDDVRFARSRLRRAVWPALASAFPDAEATLAAAAARVGEWRAAWDEWSALDLDRVADAEGLALAAWRQLSPARRANVLRAWLAREGTHAPPVSLVARLLREADGEGAASWPAWGGAVWRHRGRLRFVAAAPGPVAARAAVTLDLDRPGLHRLPGWAGAIEVSATDSGGVAPGRLRGVTLAPRHGGETFQFGPGRPPRSLKKQFQAAGVAPWERDGPLLSDAAGPLFVAGLGTDARAWAAPGEPQYALRWCPDSPERVGAEGRR